MALMDMDAWSWWQWLAYAVEHTAVVVAVVVGFARFPFPGSRRRRIAVVGALLTAAAGCAWMTGQVYAALVGTVVLAGTALVWVWLSRETRPEQERVRVRRRDGDG